MRCGHLFYARCSTNDAQCGSTTQSEKPAFLAVRVNKPHQDQNFGSEPSAANKALCKIADPLHAGRGHFLKMHIF
jgi:hypothetical protein